MLRIFIKYHQIFARIDDTSYIHQFLSKFKMASLQRFQVFYLTQPHWALDGDSMTMTVTPREHL